MGRPRLYSTPDEVKAANCRKSTKYYKRNAESISAKRRGARLRLRSATSKQSDSPSSTTNLAEQPTPKSDLELLQDRVTSLTKQFNRLTEGLEKRQYLSKVIKGYETASSSEPDQAKDAIDDRIKAINKVQEALSKYQRLILNLEGVGKVYKASEELVSRMKSYEGGLTEIWEGAVVDRTQFLADFRRGRLSFLK
ncbi:hypothetical protein DFP72DRAFT_1075488 [Ephemerocybe angulata]|uniref:Uncharacterized protein n=1 Tax=Ephemerocybe angulata TaxID=980116 RepID=A0A8H6HK64_9AGAR|nr:hypothetical protein DFP72DRAFT_1075488 [Tulosesus angulatus]